MSEDERLLTVEEVAAWLQIPKGTLYQWRNKGYGPRGIPVGRYIRYRRGDVATWLEEQQAAARTAS